MRGPVRFPSAWLGQPSRTGAAKRDSSRIPDPSHVGLVVCVCCHAITPLTGTQPHPHMPGTYGSAEEVASLVKFLLTDPASAYITGQIISIDGGMSMQ